MYTFRTLRKAIINQNFQFLWLQIFIETNHQLCNLKFVSVCVFVFCCYHRLQMCVWCVCVLFYGFYLTPTIKKIPFIYDFGMFHIYFNNFWSPSRRVKYNICNNNNNAWRCKRLYLYIWRSMWQVKQFTMGLPFRDAINIYIYIFVGGRFVYVISVFIYIYLVPRRYTHFRSTCNRI